MISEVKKVQTGQKLQQMRKQAGLTQGELAGKMYVSRDLISKWETGERRPGYDYLVKVAEILSCDLCELTETDSLSEQELSSCFPEGFSERKSSLEELFNSFLRTLSERECNVFIRRYYFFEDSAKIGRRYGISAGHVRMLLTRSRKKLTKFLTEAE